MTTPTDTPAAPAARFELDGHIGRITLDRPGNRNCMTAELLDDFAEAGRQARASAARCVVITGTGSCFSAGADLNLAVQRAAGQRPLSANEQSYAMYAPFLSVLDIEVPVIGALNGHAIGGGFGLAMVCDIRVANAGAKYGANFARIGLHPGMAISYLLPRLVGAAKAAELLFCGRIFSGAEGAEMGLFNHAVPAEQVGPRADELAAVIAANAPIAVRMMKRTFYEGLGGDVRAGAWREAWAQAVTVDTADAREGIEALLAKRKPRFLGE